MTSQFDIVNMRLLMYALSEAQWKKTLNNIHRVLRPEVNLAKDPVKSWLLPFNRMFLKHSGLTGHVPDLTKCLPEILHTCSFFLEKKSTGQFPLGIIGKACRSLRGASLEGDEVFTAWVAKMIISKTSVEALAGFYLDDDDGNPITTESG